MKSLLMYWALVYLRDLFRSRCAKSSGLGRYQCVYGIPRYAGSPIISSGAVAIEIFCGISLFIGARTRLGAAVLALFHTCHGNLS